MGDIFGRRAKGRGARFEEKRDPSLRLARGRQREMVYRVALMALERRALRPASTDGR